MNNILAIKKVHDGYIVHRVGEEAHSHYRHRSGCRQLIKLFELGVKPRNPYHREAMRRVLTQEEWEGLKEYSKQQYINRRV